MKFICVMERVRTSCGISCAKQARPYDIGPGNPSPIERIESGLLSYGGDNDDNTNPFEVRLGKYVDLHLPDEVVGIKALRELHAAGIKRHQLGVKLTINPPSGTFAVVQGL